MPIRPENRARYGEGWKALSQRLRFERAAGRCECDGRCGSPRHAYGPAPEAEEGERGGPDPRCTAVHLEQHPSTGSRVTLTVAHLDRTPENLNENNLMAMCQACHLAYDRDQHKASRRARA